MADPTTETPEAELSRLRKITRALMAVYSAAELEGIISHVLQKRGRPAACKFCTGPILWTDSAEGLPTPHDPDGGRHHCRDK